MVIGRITQQECNSFANVETPQRCHLSHGNGRIYRAAHHLLATKGITHEIQIPDISTKEKAQQAIGLNMEQIKAEKQDFIKTVIPQWEEQARKNGLLSQ